MGKWGCEINKKYGKLTVIDVFRKNNVTYAKCRCDCGNEKITRLASLKRGDCTSCGCAKRYNLEGQRFGKLTVIKFDHSEKQSLSLKYGLDSILLPGKLNLHKQDFQLLKSVSFFS